MRLATWNVNSLTVRLPRVIDWVSQQHPDVLCLQETKQTDGAFPAAAFAELGYEAVHHGEGRWNGVAIVSRVGLGDVQRGFGEAEDQLGARLIAAICGGIRILSVYVPNGRSLDSEHYEAKLAWLARLRHELAALPPEGETAVLGDFNVAPVDADVWDIDAMVGMTHVSGPERRAIEALADVGYEDVFRRCHPEGGIFSWWDYRDGSFHKGHGMRIDLVLASATLASRARDSFVDRDARKGHKPSDHAPVVVDFD